MDESTLDCGEAMERLYEYLDGELTQQLEHEIRAHLTGCAECFPRFHVEGAFLAFLRARTTAKQMPADARRRLVQDFLGGEPPH